MNRFLTKIISNTNLEQEIKDIGYDNNYAHKAKEKFQYTNLKIYNITSAQGNIIKQIALSVGADCATNKDVITGKAEKSDCILGGNFSQLHIIAKKLQLQPFGLKELGTNIEERIQNKAQKNKTKLVGILNITKDSFSDGGQYYNTEYAIIKLNELIKEGADVIDIGAESTKPYSLPIAPEKQIEKIIPVLKYIHQNNINIPISIDTRSSQVASECIKNGASIINDVSGFSYDNKMAELIAQNPNIKIIIQHSKGTPENMQDNPEYHNLMDEIYLALNEKLNYALTMGIKKDNIIIDAGIGFGKTREHNFEIIQRWQELKSIGCPIMLGLSRKSLLNMQNASNDEKDIYSLALGGILINEGIDYLRVHNVNIHKKFQNMLIN